MSLQRTQRKITDWTWNEVMSTDPDWQTGRGRLHIKQERQSREWEKRRRSRWGGSRIERETEQQHDFTLNSQNQKYRRQAMSERSEQCQTGQSEKWNEETGKQASHLSQTKIPPRLKIYLRSKEVSVIMIHDCSFKFWTWHYTRCEIVMF